MKKISLLAFVLAFALCLPLLVACRDNSNDGYETTLAPSPETTTSNNETTIGIDETTADDKETTVNVEETTDVSETTVPETTVASETTAITETTVAPETTIAPETEVSETEAPETEVPETEAPETEAPETEAPETEAPETEAPETTVAPETEARETEAPKTTVAPETTLAPETEAPETEAPETTVAPETEAPETEAPETTVAPETEAPETEPEENPITGEVINGHYVVGDKAYQLYNFNEQHANRYVQCVMDLAIKLNGLADVYSIVAPTSAVIYLSDREYQALGTTIGREGIEYVYNQIAIYSEQLVASGDISAPVNTINLFDCLSAHRDEYIYYRTDHHWAALGAYYASRYFLDIVGKSYPSLDQYKEIRIDNFLGAFYNSTQSTCLENNPDTVYAYESPTVTKFKVLAKNATALKVKPIINPNVTSWNKYVCFIDGDRPYSVIHNETINDGSAILIIKDSFGNAFSPMLADSYEYVHIIDYRHWSGNLASFVQDNNVDTVLLLINSKAPTSNTSMTNLENFLKQE